MIQAMSIILSNWHRQGPWFYHSPCSIQDLCGPGRILHNWDFAQVRLFCLIQLDPTYASLTVIKLNFNWISIVIFLFDSIQNNSKQFKLMLYVQLTGFLGVWKT